MMHGDMWWMPLMMWGPLFVLLALAAAVGYLWARRDPAPSPASSQTDVEIDEAAPGDPPPSATGPPASLSENERAVYELVAEAEADVLQKDLPERTGMSKATVSRVLDRLERRGLVQRVSHGMTNKVVPGDRERG